MGSEWKEIRLGDVVQIKHGWPFKSQFFNEELTGKPIVVNIGNFRYTGGFRFDSTTLKEYRDEYPAEYELEPGSVLLVMTCQTAGGEILGIPAKVPADSRTYLHNQRLGKVVVTAPSSVDVGYLYWVFLWSEFNRHLFTTATGTKILHTSPGRIEAFRWKAPPLREQQAIAVVLASLDDKIELNGQMNETLEAMARAVFRSWFVDFEPVRAKAEGRKPDGLDNTTARLLPDKFEDSPLGPVPKGWRVVPLGDHVEVAKGLSYKGEGLAEAGMALHNLNSVFEGGGYKHEGIKHYLGEYRPCHVIRAGDVIVTNTEQGHDHLLIGYSALIPKRYGDLGLFTHHTYRVRPLPESPLTPPFVHYLLLTSRFRGEVIGYTNGTTVNMLPAEGLKRPRLVLPPAELIRRFTDFVTPLIEKAEANYEESRSLTVTRDALLPKLLSGEVTPH